MQLDTNEIEYLIENEPSMNEFFHYLNEYTDKEHTILAKCTRTDIKRHTGCSYYHIQKFCERKRMNLKSYFKLVKYARTLLAELK